MTDENPKQYRYNSKSKAAKKFNCNRKSSISRLKTDIGGYRKETSSGCRYLMKKSKCSLRNGSFTNRIENTRSQERIKSSSKILLLWSYFGNFSENNNSIGSTLNTSLQNFSFKETKSLGQKILFAHFVINILSKSSFLRTA